VTTVRIDGIDNVLNLLSGLPKEVVSKRGGPVLRALRAGARVIQKEAALNLARNVNAFDDDGDRQSTGLLLKNLVVTRGKEPTGSRGERMLVRVRRKSYQRKGEPVTTLKTAQILEYGSSQQPAEPWIRPAFNSKAMQAINVTIDALLKDLDRIVRKLGKKGGLS
jgi:hypothetical protein